MRVLSLFSGIGAFEVALNEEHIEWELDHFCEIDKYAVKSYNQIHGTTDEDNLKDVTNIDYSKIGNIDLVTYGFPCQDISLAGKQKGFIDEDGNVTRSGLFFTAADIINHVKPKFAIFENVKNLTGKKFKGEFDAVIETLDEIGYNTYWKVLNAKNYGIPQNRERVFGISIRKDIDKGFDFPEPVELQLRLKDMLEKDVDEKYYLSEKVTKRLKITDPSMSKNIIGTTKPDFRKIGQRDAVYQTNGIIGSLVATDYKQPKQILEEVKIQQVGNIVSTGNWDNPQRGRIYSTNGISLALNTVGGGGLEPKIIEPVVKIKEATKKGYAEATVGDSINLEQPNSKTRRGRVGHGVAQTITTSPQQPVVEPKIIEPMICVSRGRNPENSSDRTKGVHTEQRLEINPSGCSNTLTTVQKDNYVLEPTIVGSTQKHAAVSHDGICPTLTQAMGTGGGHVPMHNYDYRIRKLTPKECWRLMGFKDEYFDKVKGVSNTQLYKQAGNSIVVDVIRALIRQFKVKYPEYFTEDVWEDDL